jgi:hypothetical protein
MAHPPARELLAQNLAVSGVVIDNQRAYGGGIENVPRRDGSGVELLFQPHGKVKGGALTRLAFHVDLAVHQFDELTGDCQSQPGAAIAAGGGTIGLGERLEQSRLGFR